MRPLTGHSRHHPTGADPTPEPTGTGRQEGTPASAGLAAILVSLTVLFGLLFTQLFALGSLLAGVRVGKGAVLAGFALAAVVGAVLGAHTRPRSSSALLIPASVVLLAALAGLACDRFLDLSFDGVAYHQEAVIQLREGWNLLRVHDLPRPAPRGVIITHYPKGPWLVAAALFDLTGRIESAKLVNLLLLACAYAATLGALQQSGLARGTAAHVFAVITAGNPVALCQTASFLVDGQLASLLTCGVAFGVILITRPNALAWTGLLASASLALTTKFTAVVFLPALLLGLWVISRRRRREITRPLLLTGIGICGLALVLGFNPYVTNFVRDGNPLFPVVGRNSVDSVLSGNIPDDLRPLGTLGRLGASLLAASDNPTPGRGSVRLKFPFTLERHELGAFYSGDPRVGGFGPLFSGALTLSLLLLLASWANRHPDRDIVTLVVTGLVASALAIGPAWWARLVPALWLVPVVTAVAALGGPSGRTHRWLARSTVAVLLLNVSLLSYSYLAINWTESRQQRARLTRLAASAPVEVSFVWTPALRVRLREAGVRFVQVSKATCTHPDTASVPGAAFCDYARP